MLPKVLLGLLLATACALCACAGTAGSGPAPQPTAEPAPLFTAEPAPLPTAQPMPPPQWLAPGNEAGRYVPAYTDETQSHTLLTWVDYAALRQTPLCSLPGCPHTEESCMAVLPQDSLFMGLYALPNGQLITKFATVGAPGRLYLCQGDGSEPRLLLESDGTPFAADAQTLWLLERPSFDGTEQSKLLYRLPLAGGEPEFVAEIGYWDTVLGLYGSAAVVKSTRQKETDAQPQNIHTVFSVDLCTGAQSELLQWTLPPEEPLRCIWQDDTLYRLSGQAQLVLQWDRADGAHGEITLDPSAFALEGPYTHSIAGVWGGLVLVDVGKAAQDPDPTHTAIRLAVDPVTGTVEAATLNYFTDDGQAPVPVLGQTGGDLLVEFERRITRQNGGSLLTCRWGLLNVKDFAAGRPNYREITLPYDHLVYDR